VIKFNCYFCECINMVVFYYSNFAYPQKNSKKMIPAFKSRIIDMHAHVGNWDNKSFDTNSFDVFLNSKFNKNDSIEKVIVSNLDCINPSIMQDEFVGNSDLLAFFENCLSEFFSPFFKSFI